LPNHSNCHWARESVFTIRVFTQKVVSWYARSRP
jgi:hypothetical protein